MKKYLIVNADDFGYGAAVNRGIVECIDTGVVTSVSLMVNTPGTEEALRLAFERPRLSVGLHANFTNEAQRLVEFDDPSVCTAELGRQFDRFVELMGRLPTHIDSHQHVHRRRPCQGSFKDLATLHGIPLRDQPPVTFKGGFYGQWEYGVSDPSKVSFEAVERIVRKEIGSGIYELAVHPGYFDPAVHYVYHKDREFEREALCDPRIRAVLHDEAIHLISYYDLQGAVADLADGA